MKILQEKYPMGSLPSQKSAGRYFDEQLYENLKILAKAIMDDNSFVAFVFSSTYEVGTGKSVFVSQMGEAWSDIMKKEHGIDLPFSEKNCVFRPKDLIKRAFEVPRYSFLWLDEWEDLHWWSDLGMTLRQFFRKCRQLNLFIVGIIPNYFQLPLPYAISRSVFAIDVRFHGEFQRGHFSFYNFERKRDLYIKGKRFNNYLVAKPNFIGRFTKGYGIPEEAYREAKKRDLVEEEEVKLKPNDIKAQFIEQLIAGSKGKLSQSIIAEWMGVSQPSVSLMISKKNERFAKEIEPYSP